jgi:hypothetical protein
MKPTHVSLIREAQTCSALTWLEQVVHFMSCRIHVSSQICCISRQTMLSWLHSYELPMKGEPEEVRIAAHCAKESMRQASLNAA